MNEENQAKQPVEVLSRTTRIVMLSMASVMVCVTIVLVIVTFNERSTQRNADATTRIAEQISDQNEAIREQNEALQVQLECLRIPQFEADASLGNLLILLGRGLADVAEGDQAGLAQLGSNLAAASDDLEMKLLARGESIQRCTGG